MLLKNFCNKRTRFLVINKLINLNVIVNLTKNCIMLIGKVKQFILANEFMIVYIKMSIAVVYSKYIIYLLIYLQ